MLGLNALLLGSLNAQAPPGVGGFGGPAVLGRGIGSTTGQRGETMTGIGFYAGVLGTIDSGLTGLRLDDSGNVLNRNGKGVDGFAGVYGTKRQARGMFGINYSGHYRHYSGLGSFNGTDQSLSLYTNRQLTKRSTTSFYLSASTTNRPYGMTFLGGGIDPTAGSIFGPNGEIFDNRVYYGNGGGEYVYQKSARLSFSLSGSGFVVRRSGGILFGVNGATSSANVAYRLSRRQTVSFGYQFFTYNFTRRFGDSYANGGFVGYSLQLGKRTQLGVQAGAYRLESLGLQRTAVDPVIAALIGLTSVDEVFYSTSYLPNGQANLSFQLNRFNRISVNGGILASPGNGVINTSRNTYGGLSYNYGGFRNWGLGGNVFYSRLSSLIGRNQVFETLQSSASVNRRIVDQFFFTVNGGNRRFLSTNTNNFKRNSYFISVGFTWSPQQIPISIR